MGAGAPLAAASGSAGSSVAVLIVGQTLHGTYPEGWENVRRNVLAPLGTRAAVRSFVCTDMAEPRLPAKVGAQLSLAHQFFFATNATGNPHHAACGHQASRHGLCRASSQPMLHRMEVCYELAMAWAREREVAFTHVVRARPDTYWHGNLPLHLPDDHVAVRARSLAAETNITLDYAAWPELCTPCGMGGARGHPRWEHEPCAVIDDQFAVMPIALAPAYFLAAPPLVAHRQAARANASAEPGPAPATRRRGKTGWRTTADGNAVYVLDMEPAAVARCTTCNHWAESILSRRLAAHGVAVGLAPFRFCILGMAQWTVCAAAGCREDNRPCRARDMSSVASPSFGGSPVAVQGVAAACNPADSLAAAMRRANCDARSKDGLCDDPSKV